MCLGRDTVISAARADAKVSTEKIFLVVFVLVLQFKAWQIIYSIL